MSDTPMNTGALTAVSRPQADDFDLADFDLDSLRDTITDDLETTQGPYRAMPAWKRYWPVGVATLLGIFFMGIWPSGEGGNTAILVASIAGAIAAVLCVLASAVAPSRPAAAERVAIAGIVVAMVALSAEGYLAFTAPDSGIMLKGIIKCGGFVIGFGLLPFGFLVYAMKRSGAPARTLHVLAMGAAALAVGGVAIWRHCPDGGLWHVMIGHVLGPALLLPVLALLIWAPLRASQKR